MKNATTTDPTTLPKPWRLWPGIAAVLLQWLVQFVVPTVAPDALAFGVLGGLAGGLVVLLWWAFFSRSPHADRWGAIVLIVVAMLATSQLVHESIAGGMMGLMLTIYAVPVLSLALVGWAVVTHRWASGPRRLALLAAVVIACGGWTLVRTGGMSSAADSDFAWRWAPTPEDRLLAQLGDDPVPPTQPIAPTTPPPATPESTALASPTEATVAPAVADPIAPVEEQGGGTGDEGREEAAEATAAAMPTWPGFRGADRNGILAGTTITTDWTTSPPQELWRRPIGPGWSSFAVVGNRVYTQEQRGEDEVVACYDLLTGEPVWIHRDTARFWESNAGAGPRGTPTLAGNHLYSVGATGIVNALDAHTGQVVWARNAVTDTGASVPDWGISSSPLVVDDLVVVAASGALVAYDRTNGEPRWLGPVEGTSYSSAQLLTVAGVVQILHLHGAGLTSFDPSTGTPLWSHLWKGYPIVQPAQTADGDLLIAVNESNGIRRLDVSHDGTGWNIAEVWTSRGLKPYFNDFVVHKGFAYGFDGRMLAAIDLSSGERSWKGGRFGNGQLLLLPDQDVLVVLSEKGEIGLVAAKPDAFTELARLPAIEGKTWNHPVLADGILLVRNDEEMAAFRLAQASAGTLLSQHR